MTGMGRRLREACAHMICVVVFASASRSGGSRRARGNYRPMFGSAVRAAPVLARNDHPSSNSGRGNVLVSRDPLQG